MSNFDGVKMQKSKVSLEAPKPEASRSDGSLAETFYEGLRAVTLAGAVFSTALHLFRATNDDYTPSADGGRPVAAARDDRGLHAALILSYGSHCANAGLEAIRSKNRGEAA